MVEERGDNFGTDKGGGPSMTPEDERELTDDELDEEEDDSEEGEEEEEDDDDDESEDEEDGDDEGDDDGDEEDDEEELLAADVDSDSDELPACPICLDRLKMQDVGLPESCDHQFCLECLLEWSRNVNTCPIDRQPFNIILARHPGEDKVFKRISVEDHHLNDVEMLEEEEDTTACEVCGQSDREDRLLLCDGCDNGYHCECLNPPLEDVPVEEWFCPICSEINRQADAEAKEQGETDLPVRAHRRRIARTRVSERVRHRIQIFRLNERRPLELMSSEDEQMIDHGSATSAAQRKTPQKTGVRKTRKRRRSRKRKSTKKRKTKKGATTGTSPKGKKRKTRKRKGKTRRRKGTKKRKVSCRTTSAARRGPSLTSQAFSIPLSQTIKGRIAERLGLSKPPPGRTIPLQRRPADRGIDVRRGDSFSAGLSILGDRDELIQFHDVDDEFPATQMHPVIKNTDKAMLASLIMKKEHIKRAIPASRIAEGVPVLASGPASFDLLGSIFQEQSLLHMDSSHVHICRDGSLKATKPFKMPTCSSPPSVPTAGHIHVDHDTAEGNPDSQPFSEQPADEGEPGGESPNASTQDTTSTVNVTSSGQPSSTSEQVASSSSLPEQQTSALSSSSASLGSEDDRSCNVPTNITDSPHLVPKENDYPEKKRKASRWSDASLDAGPASSSSDRICKTDTKSVKTSDIDINQEPVTTTNDNILNDNSVSDIEGCSSGNDNSVLAFGDEDTAKTNTLWTAQTMDNVLSQNDAEEGEIMDSETGINYEMHSAVSDKGNKEDVSHGEDMELEEDAEMQNKEEEEIDEEEEGEGRVGAPFTLANFLSQLSQNPDFAQTSTSGSAATEDDPKPNQMMEYVHGCYVRVNKNKVDMTDLDKRLDALSRQRREERYLLQMYGIEQERFRSQERTFEKDREERGRDRDDRPRESRHRSRSGSRDRRRRSRSREGRRSRRSKSRSRSRSPEKKSQKRLQDAGEDEVKGEERSWRSRAESDRQDRYGDRSKNRDRDAGSRRRSRSPKPGREDYGSRRISSDDSDRFARTGWRASQDLDRRGEGGRRGRGYGWDSSRGGYENNRNRGDGGGGGYREDRGMARSSRQGDWNARGNNSKPGDSSYRQNRFDSDSAQGQQEVSQDREPHSSLAGDSAYNKQDTFPSKQLPLQQMSHQLHSDLYNQTSATSFISPAGQGQAPVSSYVGQTQAPSSSAGFPPWMTSSQPPPDFSQPPPPPSSINLLSNGDFDSLKKSLALLTGMGSSSSPAGTPGISSAQPIYHLGSLGPTAAQSANAFPSLPLQTASGYGVGTISSIPTPTGPVPTPSPVEPWRNYKQAQSTGFGELGSAQSFSEPVMTEGTSGEAHVEDVQLDIPVPPSGDQTKDFQEQVIEEVKVAIRPFYASKQISKDQYKEILRKCVPKVCNSGEINSRKIGHLVAAYVKKMQASRQK